MAWTASGIYVSTMIDALDTTQLALNLDLETHRVALYTNSLTPNFDTDTAYSATNEVSGTGYTAGGELVTTTTWTGSSGTGTWDCADPSWTSSTITARGANYYADALAGNNLICGQDFTQDYTSTAGTFTIQIAAGGVFTWDMTP